MKTIYLLLTCSNTIFSQSIRLLTTSPYTHVALSLDGVRFYSFGRKNPYLPYPAGLVQELRAEGYLARFPHTRCALLTLEVSEGAYRRLEVRLNQMIISAKYYRYNLLGALLCGLGIAYTHRRRYFCSQFVGELLTKSDAALLPKVPSLMQPMDYAFLPGVQVLYTGQVGALFTMLSSLQNHRSLEPILLSSPCIPA